MASGRVGGARAKVRGQVGDLIYQVVRNDDGSYSQEVYAKAESKQDSYSPRLQAQRMCTCMVEALMRDLKPVATISMQSGANKSKSLNAFSSMNLMHVASDCKANWYGGNQYVYPVRQEMNNLGGRFLISSGTLSRNLFNRLVYDDTVSWLMELLGRLLTEATYLELLVPSSIQTIGELLKFWGMTRRDTLAHCWWHYGAAYVEIDDTFYPVGQYEYAIWQVNETMPDNTPVTPENLQRLFSLLSNTTPFIVYDASRMRLVLGYALEVGEFDHWIYYHGAFSISYADGKKKISSSRLSECYPEIQSILDDATPSKVFGSWLEPPTGRPQPSIFT